jgi:hypothetical protein
MDEVRAEPEPTPPALDASDAIERGDFYEDCSYEPMLCVKSDYPDDDLVGISLLSGRIGSCSPMHCGPVKLTGEEAIHRRLNWRAFATARGLALKAHSVWPELEDADHRHEQ